MINLPEKELYRVDEVAKFFGVHRSSVYIWIDDGLLGAEKYSGTIRIPNKAIKAFRKKGKNEIEKKSR